MGSDSSLRADLERATQEQRVIRRSLVEGEGPDGGVSLELGIGGSRNPAALKCLHAHVAFALARPGYRLGEAMLAEISERWPERCCAELIRKQEPAERIGALGASPSAGHTPEGARGRGRSSR